jgi:hypothetical protein
VGSQLEQPHFALGGLELSGLAVKRDDLRILQGVEVLQAE